MIGEHFWREPPQENESRTVIGLFRERNVCRFEAAAWDGERCVTPARAAAKETKKTSDDPDVCLRHNLSHNLINVVRLTQ